MNRKLSCFMFLFCIFSCKPKQETNTSSNSAISKLSDEQQKKLLKKANFELTKKDDIFFLTPTNSENQNNKKKLDPFSLVSSADSKTTDIKEIDLLVDDQGVPLSLVDRVFTPEGIPYSINKETIFISLDKTLDSLPIPKEILNNTVESNGVETNVDEMKSTLLSYMRLILSQIEGIDPSILEKLTDYTNVVEAGYDCSSGTCCLESTFYLDTDGDGWTDGSTEKACTSSPNYYAASSLTNTNYVK